MLWVRRLWRRSTETSAIYWINGKEDSNDDFYDGALGVFQLDARSASNLTIYVDITKYRNSQ